MHVGFGLARSHSTVRRLKLTVPLADASFLSLVFRFGIFMRISTNVAIAFLLLACGTNSSADTFGVLNQFDIEFVTVGDPGNADDTTGNPIPAGKVDYVYRIGKYEISEDMINKANAEGRLGITHDNRGPNMPATSITWLEAAKFVNWLNTSTSNPAAYKFSASGSSQLWQPSDAGYNANNPLRNSRARYFLPSMDEWYKAAYYDPATSVYYNYPTGSNSVPDGIDFAGDPNFDIVVSDGFINTAPLEITDAGVLSRVGTVGQGGNVSEWEESPYSPSSPLRGVRGSAYPYGAANANANTRAAGLQTTVHPTYGFRVASVPEPNSAIIAMLMPFGLLFRRRR